MVKLPVVKLLLIDEANGVSPGQCLAGALVLKEIKEEEALGIPGISGGKWDRKVT